MDLSRSALIIALCVIYSLIAGLYPFEFVERSLVFNDSGREFLTHDIRQVLRFRVNDFLTNIAYFLPWGIICYIVLGSTRTAIITLISSTALIAAMVSVTIELCQLFFNRHPSAFDVLANTFGAALGALLCALSPIDVRQAVARCLAKAEPSR